MPHELDILGAGRVGSIDERNGRRLTGRLTESVRRHEFTEIQETIGWSQSRRAQTLPTSW
jgi:hypothetical protein